MAIIATLEDRIAFCVWFVIALLSMVANGFAIYLLTTKRKRKKADILLLHLCIAEFFGVAWNVILRPLNMVYSIKYISIYNNIGNQILGALYYLSIIWISVDRLLAAALSLKYKVLVTKGRMLMIAMIVWLFSIICAIISGIKPSLNFFIWMFWSTITTASILISYSYILIVLYRQKHRFRRNSFIRIGNQRFNYEVLLCITLSYIVTMFIPDMVIVIDKELYTVWILVIWYTNHLIDPLIYVFFRIYYNKRSPRQLPVLSRSSNLATITTKF